MSDAQPDPNATLFQVLGAPSSLTYACCALVQTMADAMYGTHSLIQAVFLDDVKKRWVTLDRNDPKPIVLISDCPSSALVEVVLSTRAPFLLVLDDFEETVFQVIETRDMGLVETLRVVTQSFCSLDAARSAAALVLTAKDSRRSLQEILTRFAEHFGLENPVGVATTTLVALGYDEKTADTLFQHIVKSGLRLTSPASRALRADSEGQAVVKLMASQYDAVGAMGARRIEWPTEMWLDADRHGQALRGPIEMMGPARFLIYGPYFHLPAGRWIADIVIELADNRSGNRLTVDVYSGEVLGGVVTPLPASGVFSFQLAFAISDPFLPVELRFQLLEGAIEGRLALRGVAFARTA